MTHQAVKSFLGVGVVVLATVLAPVAVQAQSTNTTIQNGRININRTYQQGDSNTNTTSQTGMVNINRTIQLGGGNSNPTGSFGWFNHSGMESGRGFQGIGFDRDGDARGHAAPGRVQRWSEGRRDRRRDEDRQ
jgi:hypothetical protein